MVYLPEREDIGSVRQLSAESAEIELQVPVRSEACGRDGNAECATRGVSRNGDSFRSYARPFEGSRRTDGKTMTGEKGCDYRVRRCDEQCLALRGSRRRRGT